MGDFAYQTPNKGNDIPADTFLVTGDGYPANQLINWTVVLSGTVNANLGGSFSADADGNVNTSFSSPEIEAYYADPTMPKISGGQWELDGIWPSLSSWQCGAMSDTESIILTAQMAT